MHKYFAFAVFFLYCIQLLVTQEIGPKSGSLVIVGGGRLEPSVVQRFMDLAGGPQVKIIIRWYTDLYDN